MIDAEAVRRIVGEKVSVDEAEAIVGWYANLARGVAAFSEVDLKWVEPPLRSVAGPRSARAPEAGRQAREVGP